MTKWLTYFVKLTMILLILVIILVYISLKSSLPILNGQINANVTDPVQITRDNYGVPFIKASSASDYAFALGWLHGQERFFQMDLLRRNSAGELSELFGKVALSHDKKVRQHQFRQRAQQRLAELPASHRSIVSAYTQGVNDGLSDLTVRPFEYLLLNTSPVKWHESDSFLVLLSMYMDLQDEYGEREKLLGHLHSRLMKDVFEFINPNGSNWDASIDNFEFESVSIPTNGFEPAPIIDLDIPITTSSRTLHFSPFVPYQHEALKGSNSWAVTGDLTPYNSAMLANDMHLGIGVPNIWYRASAEYEINGQRIESHGVTLPGVPALIVGSNTHIAWGFTNSYGDWSDLIIIDQLDDSEFYDTPEGPKQFVTDYEVIKIKGQAPVEIEIKKTIWGPVISTELGVSEQRSSEHSSSEKGHQFAMRWVAHDPEGVNFNLFDLILSRSVDSAIEVAKTMGIPAQNFTVVDRKGNAAWTIAGAIPNKQSSSPTQLQWQIPQSWSSQSPNAAISWDGYISPADYPVVMNPVSNRIWTGNSRVVGGEDLDKIGNGGYALGARSRQIANNLTTMDDFTEEDFLHIQNDDRAEFLTHWHKFMVTSVIPSSSLPEQQKQDASSQLAKWNNRASIDSVAYTLVREFRLQLRSILFNELFSQVLAMEPENIDFRSIRSQLESPMWLMITNQPKHLLPKRFISWQALFDLALKNTIDNLEGRFGALNDATWGIANQTHIQHPLSPAIPALGWLLDMPRHQVSGDSYMPKVQGSRFGASQRLVVAPGHEQTAIFHMPSGQSAHPLSPYFGAGHNDWINGTVSPLLPQVTKYHLTLQPK